VNLPSNEPGSRIRLVHILPLAATQGVGLICGLIGVRWSSAVVPPEALGIYGLLLSAQPLASTVTHQGLIKHVQQFWNVRTPGRSYLRPWFAAGVRPLGWLVAGLAVVTTYFAVSTCLPFPAVWWVWLVAVNLLGVVSATGFAALHSEGRYWGSFGLATVGSASRSFLPPLLVVLGGSALPMLGFGFLLHALLFAAVAVWCHRQAWQRGSNEAGVFTTPQDYTRIFLGVGLFGWIAAAAPRWLAAQALDATTTGYFMLATNLAMIVPATFHLLAENYFVPSLFAASRTGAGQRELYRMTVRAVATVMLGAQVGLFCLAAVAPWLVGVVIDARYAPATDWILAAGGGVLATLSLPCVCHFLAAIGRQSSCTYFGAISAGLRLAVLATLAAAGHTEAFRNGLCLLPWLTLAVDWWLVRRLTTSLLPT